MSEKTKNILTTIAIIIVFIFLGKEVYDYRFGNSTRWQFMTSVPESEYEEYIIGKWEKQERLNRLVMEYTEDGLVKYSRPETKLENQSGSKRRWEIENNILTFYVLGQIQEGHSGFYHSKIIGINKDTMVLYNPHPGSNYTYYTRIK